MQSFWSTADLRSRGKTARSITAAVGAGSMLPVRPGWYARPGTDPELVRAVRVGGVATAHTAARARGLWTPPDDLVAASRDRARGPVLHVAVPGTASIDRLRDPDDAGKRLGTRDDVFRHWVRGDLVRSARGVGMLGPLDLLRDLFRCETPERALAVVDSALHHRHLRTGDLAALAALLPAHLRPLLDLADARAQSGTETIARVLLRAAGLAVEPQVVIPGVGAVDLLVEGRLVVEVDGRDWHDDDEAFERDRRRDLIAALGRYRVVRFTWFQVLFQWPQVEAAVFAALAA